MELPDNLDFNCIFADHDQGRSETIEKTPPPTPVTLSTFAALPLSENPLRICSFEHEGSAVSYSLISKQGLFRALSRTRAWKHTATKPRLPPPSPSFGTATSLNAPTKKAQSSTPCAFDET